MENRLDRRSTLPITLNDIKSRLPKECSFLSPLKRDGEYQAIAIVKGEEYRYTLPYDLNFTSSDIEELYNQIFKLCHTTK